ncbi:MAG: xanthine dehydrogenase family protein subunit M [Gammaproteobacteria bacterium]
MQYARPSTIDDAVRRLTETGARVLAGGTDLLVQMRGGALRPRLIVDIKGIAELRRVEQTPQGFRVGAAVAGAELGEHAGFARQWPGVVEAFQLIGSTQVQGRASLGGNLCNASPAADSVPALIAAGARCTVAGPQGRREVAVEDVCIGPGKTSLAPGEFVVDFLFATPPARTGDAYLRFIPRTEMDIAVVGAGVCLTLDASGRCSAARVGLGAVAPRPLLVPAAADALVGTTVDDAALAKLAAAASAACQPIDDKRGTIEFRTRVAGVLARRAAVAALARARGQ